MQNQFEVNRLGIILKLKQKFKKKKKLTPINYLMFVK